MNRDELNRDKVVEWLSNETTLLEVECEAAGDGLMSLIAPVIEAAEKWKKVEEIAKYKGNCGECPNDSLCMEFPTSACYICEGVVAALSEAPHGN